MWLIGAASILVLVGSRRYLTGLTKLIRLESSKDAINLLLRLPRWLRLHLLSGLRSNASRSGLIALAGSVLSHELVSEDLLIA